MIEEMEIRRLLWLRHGCPVNALYGDDGEMQCGLCLVDFKRDAADDMLAKFQKNNWKEPHPDLAKKFPLVLYFDTNKEAQEFVKLVQEVKPNLKEHDLKL